jgi:hypothetical protein
MNTTARLFHLSIFFIFILGILHTASALGPIHDAQYNYQPEIFKVDDGYLGVGVVTHFNGDASIPLAIKFGVSDKLELGGRLNMNIHNNTEDFSMLGDIGMRFKYSSYEIIQTDLVFGLGNSAAAASVGYTTLRKYTDLIYSHFQAKVGLFDAMTQGRGLFAQELGAYPEFHLGSGVVLRLGMAESFSVGTLSDIRNTFSMDMLPASEFTINSYQKLIVEGVFGIFGPQTGNYRFGVYYTVAI